MVKPEKILKEARINQNLTQTEMAKLIAATLGQTYSLRQYQRVEDGEFPKFKKEIIQAIDGILGIRIYDIIYDKNVPREPTELEDSEEAPYIVKRRDAKNAAGVYMVPVVPAKAQAGYARSYDDITFLNQLEMRPILPGVDHRGATWRFFEIQGDSMEPLLFERDLVLVSMVPPEDWAELKNKQVYVIVTEKDVMVKIVHRKDRDTWILTSSNSRHKQRLLQVKDIKEVWLYRRMLRDRLPLP